MTTDRNHETTSAGVSSRRGFMLGGAALAAGAILAACGKDSAEQIPKSGALPVPPETTTTTAPGSPATDRVLLQTAQSIELLAVEVYDAALDADLLSGSALQLATLFQAQHREHAESLADAIRAEGGRPVTEPNAYLKKNGTDEAVEAISDEETTLLLLRDIENIAAQTYTEAAGIFTRGAPPVRHVDRRRRCPAPHRAEHRPGLQPGAAALHAHRQGHRPEGSRPGLILRSRRRPASPDPARSSRPRLVRGRLASGVGQGSAGWPRPGRPSVVAHWKGDGESAG